MPIGNQEIGRTSPKTGTLQFRETRLQGLTLHIPAAAGVTSCPNNRIVTIQEDTNGNRFAVLHPVAVIRNSVQLVVVGWGVLEESLQSGGIDSISPTPNNYVDGDAVTVLRDVGDTYMIDFDSANVPDVGLASCRVDAQGRLSSVVAGATEIQVFGAVFKSVPGLQMAGQLKDGCIFYQLRDGITP